MCLKGLFTFKLGCGVYEYVRSAISALRSKMLENQSRSPLDAIHDLLFPGFYEAIDMASIISNDCD